MKSLLLLSAVFVLGTTAANADTFTFSGKNTPGSQISAPGPMGKPVFAGNSRFENELVRSNGTKMKSTGDCIAWSAAPASGFTVQGICSGTDADGTKTSVIFSCIATGTNGGDSNCWGGLTTTAGKTKGQTGTASWHTHENADGKGSTTVGAGTMN
jgi:hypothetical protein